MFVKFQIILFSFIICKLPIYFEAASQVIQEPNTQKELKNINNLKAEDPLQRIQNLSLKILSKKNVIQNVHNLPFKKLNGNYSSHKMDSDNVTRDYAEENLDPAEEKPELIAPAPLIGYRDQSFSPKVINVPHSVSKRDDRGVKIVLLIVGIVTLIKKLIACCRKKKKDDDTSPPSN